MINRNSVENKFTIFLIILSTFILAMSFFKTPKIEGDGHEYYMMTQSFYNHFSPDMQKNDVIDASKNTSYNSFKNAYLNNDENLKDNMGYFFSNSGKLYSYHFFSYSLLSVPIKFILNIFEENDLKSFQIENSILFIMMIWIIYKKIDLEENKKKILLVFLIFNPVVYYLNWTHPEVYTYVFVVLSLVYFHNKNYKISFIFMAIASLQNPPVLIFSIFAFLHNMIINFRIKNFKNIFFEGLCISIGLFPMIFYFYNFGVLNLITAKGYSSFQYISFLKIYDLFFGFAHGMILFYPFVVLVFLYLIVKNFFSKNIVNYIYSFSIFIMCIFMTTTPNWNSGMSYIIRYSIWLYPFIIFYILTYLQVNGLKKLIFLHTSFFILIFTLYRNFSYLEFNKLSRLILDSYPSLYITDYETFADNSMRSDFVFNNSFILYFPILYTNSNLQITKILTDLNGLDKLKNDKVYKIDLNWLNEVKEKHLKEKGLFFVNVPKNVIVANSVEIGKNYLTNSNGEGLIYLTEGWYGAENNFTWSAGQKAILKLPIENLDISSDIKLNLYGFSFIGKTQKYKIFINGLNIKNGEFGELGTYSFDIPNNILKDGIFRIEIILPDATSPASVGMGNDQRLLGFGLVGFMIERK